MVTVEVDPVRVERRLVSGQIRCPDCNLALCPWGWARLRALRGADGSTVRIRPRRAMCSGCQATHVLMPVVALCRRADLVEVIGAALTAKALGSGAAEIGRSLGRPRDTVRGWLRRFALHANGLRQLFTVTLVAVSPDPQTPAVAGSPFADAVAAIVGAWLAVVGRWPIIGTVSPWQLACAVTSGRLLAPPAS